MPELRLIIFSDDRPQQVARLVTRIRRELPAATLCGILYRRMLPESLGRRMRESLRRLLAPLFEAAIRFVHACPTQPNGAIEFSLDDLCCQAKEQAIAVHVTSDLNSPDSLDFVRACQADVGVSYGTRLLRPELYAIPRLGTINLQRRKVSEYRGGGPVGLWEMLDERSEIGITVHQVDESLDTVAVLRAATIPIDPYDDLESLALKAQVVGDDLFIATLGDILNGSSRAERQTGEGRRYQAPSEHQLPAYRRQLARMRKPYSARRTRPAWKLLLRTLMFLPVVPVRNWIYRRRKAFPVIILYHHVITDRPHHLGTPTAEFARQVKFLQKYYRVASLEEAMHMLEEGRVPKPTVVLTFDDGYAENFVNLRAVVEQLKIPVFLFLSTAHMSDQTPFGHDLRRGQEGFAPLTWEQVSFLRRAGFSFGCHTRSHFDCGSSDLPALEEEIVGSKRDLEAHTGESSDYFSFPWGMPENMSPAAQELARKTFAYMFAAAGGVNPPGASPRGRLLCREDYPTNIWEIELLLQSVLNIKQWRDIFPGLFSKSK